MGRSPRGKAQQNNFFVLGEKSQGNSIKGRRVPRIEGRVSSRKAKFDV